MSPLEGDPVALASEWAALADRVGANPFVRPNWILPWFEAFGSGTLRLAVLRRGDELIAALPLMRGRRRLRAPTNAHTPMFGPVAVDDAATAALLRELFAANPGTVELSLLDEATLELARDVASDARQAVSDRTLGHSPHVDLSMGWDEYLASFSRNRRKEMRRVGRRLEEQGRVTVTVDAAFDDLDAALEECFAVEGSGWKAARGTAIASDARVRGFYTEVARRAAATGTLRLCALRVDGRPIAVDLALVQGGRWYAVKGGYDVAWARYAPGISLLQRTLQHACEVEGLRRFELLGNPDPYKLVWANGASARGWLAAFAPSPRSRTAYVATSTRERLRPWALRMALGGRAVFGREPAARRA